MTPSRRRFLVITLCILSLLAVLTAVGVYFLTKQHRQPDYARMSDLSCISGDRMYTPEKTGEEYCFFLPSSAKAVTLFLSDKAGGQVSLSLGGDTATLSPGESKSFTLTESVTALSASLGEQTVPLSLCRSENLPALFLTVDESRGTIEAMEADATKKTACYGEGSLLLPDGSFRSVGDLTLSGRGNSTWQREKNPYKLNLDKKADLLNMGSSRKWALLALYDDPSLVRNMLGLSIAEELDINYVPECKPVDLYLNGKYKGTYTLTERITINPDRLDTVSLEDMVDAVLSTWNSLNGTKYTYLSDLMADSPDNFTLSKDGSSVTVELPMGDMVLDLTGGYLLEIDYYRDTPQFVLNSGTRVTVKSPDNLCNTADHPLLSYLGDYLTKAEASLDTADPKDDGYLSYFDAESFAKLWLLKEYTMDFDACVSLYMVLTPGGKLEAGPAWDLENIFALNQRIYGMADPYYQVILNGGRHSTVKSWLTKLTAKSSFGDTLCHVYDRYQTAFDSTRVSDRAKEMLSEVAASAAMNARLYPEKMREDEDTFLPTFIYRRSKAFPEVLATATGRVSAEEVSP